MHLCTFPQADIERYVLSPAVPAKGIHSQRVGKDVITWLTIKDYPSAWDAVETVRHAGLSVRVPYRFPVARLVAGQSRLFVAHPRAIPAFPYHLVVGRDVALRDLAFIHSPFVLPSGLLRPATRYLWALRGEFYAYGRQCYYKGVFPVFVEDPYIAWRPGIFMALPITHIMARDSITVKAARAAGFIVVDEKED